MTRPFIDPDTGRVRWWRCATDGCDRTPDDGAPGWTALGAPGRDPVYLCPDHAETAGAGT